MYCKKCGREIDDNAAVCPYCGVAVREWRQETVRQKNTIAVVGFIFAFLIALVGLICSIVGFRRAPECGGTGRGLALAGIIISILNMVGGVLLLSV